MNQLRHITARMKAEGLKITKPRKTILNILLDQKDPISARQILAVANKSKSSALDLTSVYRNLTRFKKMGLVCDFENGTFRYVGNDLSKGAVRLVGKCGGCGSIEELALDDSLYFNVFRALRERLSNFSRTNLMILQGVCNTCSGEN